MRFNLKNFIYKNIRSKKLSFILAMPILHLPKLVPLICKTKSGLYQELFVLYLTNYKKNGIFVEFGAADGIKNSNTYLLEKDYGWSGLLSEPAIIWREALLSSRSSSIDLRCVWKQSKAMIDFFEATNPQLSQAGLEVSERNLVGARKYKVETVSLSDLLFQHHIPRDFDYLSIDTEGSEYEILAKMDFDRYKPKIITCEHNYTENRDRIYKLLIANGYKRVYEHISLMDDWYVLE